VAATAGRVGSAVKHRDDDNDDGDDRVVVLAVTVQLRDRWPDAPREGFEGAQRDRDGYFEIPEGRP